MEVPLEKIRGLTLVKTFYLTFFILQHLLGLANGGHETNGVINMKSTNKYGKKPSLYDSEYVQIAVRRNQTEARTDWPGVNSYYKQFVDRYQTYVQSADFTRLTSAPTGENEWGNAYLGVCVNYQLLNASNPDSYLGTFTCPLRPAEPPQHTYCCGNDYAEYCCEPEQNTMSEIVGPVIVCPLFLFVMSVCLWSCFCKKKETKADEEPMNEDMKNEPPEEVRVASGTPTSGADDRKASGRTIPASGNHTSTTSLNSEGDNGYGSGQLTETKPLEPAYPPTDDDVNDQYQRDGKPKGKKEDE